MTVERLIGEIEKLIDFFEPFLSLANCHMVDFFTKTSYNYLPFEIRKEISVIGEKTTINNIFNENYQCSPNLRNYVENCRALNLRNSRICLQLHQFIDELTKSDFNDLDRFKLDVFMNEKKSHEVEIYSAVIAVISQLNKTTHLVDIGDGKGYLSSMLALHYRIPVLGIDASNINTTGAHKRVEKLSKVWNGLKKSPTRSLPKKHENLSNNNRDLYQQITKFVDIDCDLHQLIREIYQINDINLGLIGLHTCGNLAVDSLRLYEKNDYIKTICNVGCCYHLVDENDDVNTSNFPLSSYLKNKQFKIGRNARMIASQSLDRILINKQLPNSAIYYRALLQIVLEKYCERLPKRNVGKFRKSCTNFIDYFHKSCKRLNVNLDISNEKLEEFDRIYSRQQDQLNIFYLLRCKLSPIIECLILLDRLLYLKENGYNNSYIVQLFDPVISPRCYGIVSIKN